MSEDKKVEQVYIFVPNEKLSLSLMGKLLQGMLMQGRIAYPQQTYDKFTEEEKSQFQAVSKPEQPRIITG